MTKKNYIPAVAIMFALFFMIAFITGLHNPLGIIVKFQFGFSNAVSQLGNLINFLAYACMGLPAGYILKKYGYKVSSLVAVCIGILGVGTFWLSGVLESFWVYLLGAFVSGFAACMLNAVVNPMLNSIGQGGKKGNQLLQYGNSLNSLAATFVATSFSSTEIHSTRLRRPSSRSSSDGLPASMPAMPFRMPIRLSSLR